LQKRQGFCSKYCYEIVRNTRSFSDVGALNLYKRSPKCVIYDVKSTNIDNGNFSYIQECLIHFVINYLIIIGRSNFT